MATKVYEKIKSFIKENYKFIITVCLLFFVFFYELPFVIYRPGGTIDLSSRIEMEEKYDSSGKLSMAYVSMMKGNIPFVLLSFVLPNWDLESVSEVTIDNESIDDTIKRDRVYLENGLDNATISAYNLAHKEVDIKNIYHVITYITSDAKTDLQVGDIILSVNDHKFDSLNGLQNYIYSLEEDDIVYFQVLRDEKEITCSARVYKLEDSLKVGISILNQYDYEVEPKLEIKTKASESGSSGGLMTALAIYDALTEEDLTQGRNIVGTGTIDAYGNVGEISGVKYKLLGANKDHADIFLCPKENYEEAMEIKEKNNLKIEVISVSSLDEAILFLQK